ncbi:MAG: hypothetical protein RLZZ175_2543 [Bacteroidota bacterium]
MTDRRNTIPKREVQYLKWLYTFNGRRKGIIKARHEKGVGMVENETQHKKLKMSDIFNKIIDAGNVAIKRVQEEKHAKGLPYVVFDSESNDSLFVLPNGNRVKIKRFMKNS